MGVVFAIHTLAHAFAETRPEEPWGQLLNRATRKKPPAELSQYFTPPEPYRSDFGDFRSPPAARPCQGRPADRDPAE